MNNIKKLISELEVEKSKAAETAERCWRGCHDNDYNYHFGRSKAFDFCVQKLELLLKDESKQPQPPDFANTMLGEVPPVVNDQQGETSKAVEGATPVVRQNEQTKKKQKRFDDAWDDLGDTLYQMGNEEPEF